MGYELTITGESTSTLVTFGVNGYEQGRYLRQFDPGDIIPDIAKFRVPGTDGSLIIRNGIVGHQISMGVRYIAADIDALETIIATDQLMFGTEAVKIVYHGQTYRGCNLIPGSGKRTSPIKSTGRRYFIGAEEQTTDVYCDVAYKFTEDLYGYEEEEE